MTVLTDEQLAYLTLLSAKRRRREHAAQLGITKLIAALVDTSCVLVHGEESATSPFAEILAQANGCGTCLNFPHATGIIVLYVWRGPEGFMSISLTDEEISTIGR